MQTSQTKKVVKVTFKGDMKRLKLTSDYNTLVEQSHKAFGQGTLPKGFKFYYMDEDNEMISINSQYDLEEALSIEDFTTLKLIASANVSEARQQLCQEISDNASMRDSLNQSGFFDAPAKGFGLDLMRSSSLASSQMEPQQPATERAPIMRSAFQDEFETLENSNVAMVEEKKVEEPVPKALPKCSRKNCKYQSHPDQKHGWCCGRCRNKGKGQHGGACQAVLFTGAKVEESEDEMIDKDDGESSEEAIEEEVATGVRQEVREYCRNAFKTLLTDMMVEKKNTQAQVEHESVECDACEVNPIKGIRFKCSVCPDYDLCEGCEAKGIHPEHPMLKIRDPATAPTKIMCQYKDIAQHPDAVTIPQEAEKKPQEECKPRGFGTKPAAEKKFIKYSGRFVKESFSDKHKVAPGAKLTKQWTFRNDGETAWPEDTLFIQTNGDDMKTTPVPISGSVGADQGYVWEVELTAPEKEGRYQCYFRMVTGNNYRFGHKVWADILVEAPEVQKVEPVVSKFMTASVAGIKENIVEQIKQEYPSLSSDIEMEHSDKAGGEEESPLNQSIREAGLMSPKEIYNNKSADIKEEVTRKALADLFDLGFVNFEVNKAMLIKYNNDTQVVAGYLCEGILSDSCMQAVFK